jgi:hypothetical protein
MSLMNSIGENVEVEVVKQKDHCYFYDAFDVLVTQIFPKASRLSWCKF